MRIVFPTLKILCNFIWALHGPVESAGFILRTLPVIGLSSRANESFDDHDGSDHSLGFVYYAGIFVLAGSRKNVSKGLARTKKARVERLGSGGDRPETSWVPRPVLLVVAAYLVVGAASATVAVTLGRNPIQGDGWLGARGAAALLVSLGLGLCLAGTTIAATRSMVRRAAWARALHVALRPAVGRAGDGALVAVAVASAAGEELLFRGLLVPIIGVIASSVLFGALHQVRGRARWAWMAWATVMGLLFGAVFAATGSLAGPMIAHAAINHSNLRFLRDNDPAQKARPLGGLLRRG